MCRLFLQHLTPTSRRSLKFCAFMVTMQNLALYLCVFMVVMKNIATYLFAFKVSV